MTTDFLLYVVLVIILLCRVSSHKMCYVYNELTSIAFFNLSVYTDCEIKKSLLWGIKLDLFNYPIYFRHRSILRMSYAAYFKITIKHEVT